MNLDNITTQPFILSLFKREDGVRFLLGSGAYEFKNSQLHFAANAFLNDVVEIQGNDGALLAGQVRRASVQAFDGYVGDGTTIKSKVEQYRTNFLKFFQKNHFYTVIYIFPDGTAIQRRRGYIVDAPQVKELYQQYPEYHIAFNFEDVNYYKYSENAEGEETYSNLANILSSVSVSGGLIWTQASSGTETRTETGTDLVLANSTDDGFDDVEMLGATEQQTYSGKNLFNPNNILSNQGLNYPAGTTYSGPTRSCLNYTKIEGGQDYAISGLTTKVVIFYSSQDESTSLGGTNNLPASGVITAPASANYVRIAFDNTVDYSKPQLEKSSVITSYEPYVGRTASPNPDYPQAVQTVSGEQTITITDGGSQTHTLTLNLGKNLFDVEHHTIEALLINSSLQFVASTNANTVVIPIEPNTTYTVSRGYHAINDFTIATSKAYPSTTTTATSRQTTNSQNVLTITSGPQDHYLSAYVYFGTDMTALDNTLNALQAEKGSNATSYAAYFAPIELCKIGTYQDYIYKSGNDWYVHKEIKKVVFNGSENWYPEQYGVYYRFGRPISDIVSTAGRNTDGALCDHFMISTENTYGVSYYGSGYIMLWQPNSSITTAAGMKNWLASNITTYYYPLATPTETKITDATLISQLEALLGASTYNGQTLVSVSGDLKSPLTITYTASILSNGGIEWDNYGAVWEEGGGGGQAIITVDSITNVLPTIKITGPASNPVLTNITTGQAISYSGYVLDSQTLVIDVNQKTAKLNGTSVIQNVDGDWLELAPGNNRMEYTVDNADQVSAIIEWQEIVG